MSFQRINEKRLHLIIVTFVLFLFSIFWFSLPKAEAASRAVLEVEHGSSLGENAKVPVTIRNVTTITSGQFKVTLPSEANGKVRFEKFEAVPPFNGQHFRTLSNVTGNTLTVDFASTNGNQQRLARGNRHVIGYIHLKMNHSFAKGEAMKLQLSDVVAKGARGADMTLTTYDGKLVKKMPAGDVIGKNEVNAGAAVRVLQHVQGNAITNNEQIASADVDGDGAISQADALAILNNLVGNNDSLLAVTTTELGIAPVNGDYYEKIEAKSGNEPYTWSIRGRLPAGLSLNANTGVISGKTTRPADSKVTVTVTDRSGNSASRELTITAKETDVQSIATVPPVTVKIGETPQLPRTVEVTYKNGRKENVAVTWEPVDVYSPGTKTVRGKVGTTGLTVLATVTVTAANGTLPDDNNNGGQPIEPGESGGEALKKITSKYVGMLNVHTIIVETSADVYGIDVLAKIRDNRGRLVDTKIPMHFEGDNEFSLATPRLESGATIQLIIYDRVGNEMKRVPHTLE